MPTLRRLPTWALLACALSTTPCASLEQAPDDGVTPASVPVAPPHTGGDPAQARIAEPGARGGAGVLGTPGPATPGGSGPIAGLVADGEPRARAAGAPRSGARFRTHDANAPPGRRTS